MIQNKSLKKMKRDVEAISPVIATILLVLVAVASAVAFYAFTSAWQTQQQDNLDNVDISQKNLIKVAGSTTVLPMMEIAATEFMAKNPTLTVSVAAGGSGAGLSKASSGEVDIGMISKAFAGTDVEANPTLKATTIAYDGVVLVISEDAAEAHGIEAAQLAAMTSAIALQVYDGTLEYWADLVTALGGTPVTGDDAVEIVTYERNEESGTEEGFSKNVLKRSASNIDGMADEAVEGNNGMVAALQGDDNGIGFTSFGHAETNSLVCFALNGVAPSHASIKSMDYEGTRPLNVLTNGLPSGIVKQFIDFITEEENNKQFTAAVGYTSLY